MAARDAQAAAAKAARKARKAAGKAAARPDCQRTEPPTSGLAGTGK